MAGKSKIIEGALGALGDLIDRRTFLKGAGAATVAGSLPTGARIASEIAEGSATKALTEGSAAKVLAKIPGGNLLDSSLIKDALSRHFKDDTRKWYTDKKKEDHFGLDEDYPLRESTGNFWVLSDRTPQQRLVDDVRWSLAGGGDLTGVPKKGSELANQADEIMRSVGIKDPDKLTYDELLGNDALLHELGKFDPGGENIFDLFSDSMPGLKKYIATGDASGIPDSMVPMIDTLREGGLSEKAIRSRLRSDIISKYNEEEPYWLSEDDVWDLEDLQDPMLRFIEPRN